MAEQHPVLQNLLDAIESIRGDSDKIGHFLNGCDDETVDTACGPIPTLAGFLKQSENRFDGLMTHYQGINDDAASARDAAQTAAAAAVSDSGIYASTASGISDTHDGDYFWVAPQYTGGDFALYRNDSGAAASIYAIRDADRYYVENMAVDDYYFAVTDPFGLLLFGLRPDRTWAGVANKTTLADLTYRSDQVIAEFDSPYSFAVTDAFGLVAHGVLQNPTHGQPMGRDLYRMHLDTDYTKAWIDSYGLVAHGIKHDGTVLPELATNDEPNYGDDHAVYRAYIEPWVDPSVDGAVTWMSNNESQKTLYYREKGKKAWYSSVSERTRMMTNGDEWIHTAVVEDLSPDTVYEYHIGQSNYQDTWKTCKDTAGVRIRIESDMQVNDSRVLDHPGASATQYRFANFNNIVNTKGDDDFMLFVGDMLNSAKGSMSAHWAEKWKQFMNIVSRYVRTSTGHQIPCCYTLGNHDMNKDTGTGHPKELFVCGYDPTHPTTHDTSIYTVSIGTQVYIISLNTGGYMNIANQLDWFEQKATGEALNYQHAILTTHYPAFGTNHYESAYKARNLRNIVWPVMQKHDDVFKLFACAHTHTMMLSNRLTMDVDTAHDLTGSYNDRRWRSNAGHGIWQIGCGPVATNYDLSLNYALERVSDLDGSGYGLAGVGINHQDKNQTQTIGAVTNTDDLNGWNQNMWIVELNDDDMHVVNYRRDGKQFYENTLTF
jgi:hypothetical protein